MYPLKNKGMFLETILNITHQKYLNENTCVVTKIPTNIKLISTQDQMITKASFDTSFNCDYIGVYKGTYFEFEAKETSKRTFNFNLLRKNQQLKLKLVDQHSGISFVIVYFSEFESYFMISYAKLLAWVTENKKVILYEWFCEYAIELFLSGDLKLNYISKFNYLIN